MMHPLPGLRWTDCRDAAVDYASHDWPILPGTYQLADNSAWHGKRGSIGLEPAAMMWAMASTTDAAVAMEWWTRRPYSVLLACGAGVDAVEVNAEHGERAWARLVERGDRGPVVVTPFRSWLLLVKSGGGTLEALGTHVQLHTRGDWVPLPPTTRAGMPYRWRLQPAECAWTLPDPQRVQESLIDGLTAHRIGDKPRPSKINGRSDVD